MSKISQKLVIIRVLLIMTIFPEIRSAELTDALETQIAGIQD